MRIDIKNSIKSLLFMATVAATPLFMTGCADDPWENDGSDNMDYWYDEDDFSADNYEMQVIDDKNIIDKYKIEEFETTISFDTNESRDFNNKVLGLNCGLPGNVNYSLAYDHANQQEFVRNLKPAMLRFPLGVYANFYDWKMDTRFMESSDGWGYDKNGEHGASCVVRDPNDTSSTIESEKKYLKSNIGYTTVDYLRFPKLKNGVAGLSMLQKTMKFDLLWVWSVSYDKLINGVDDTDRTLRYKYYINDLKVPVTNIELGNEIWFMSQRSMALQGEGYADAMQESGYDKMEDIRTSRLKQYADQIRGAATEAGVEAPKFAIPMSWRGRPDGGTSYNDGANNTGHNRYNKAMMFPDRVNSTDLRHRTQAPNAADQEWYDAFVLHKYVGMQPDGSIGDGNEMPDDYVGKYDWTTQLQTAYEARLAWQDEFRYFQDILPDGVTKPIWMTEWGVTCGMFAASYLSMADAYLFLFERPSVEVVSWFQTHGLNPLYVASGNTASCSHSKTGYGAVFGTLDATFRDSKLYETTVDSKFVESGEKAQITNKVSAASKEGENFYPAVEGVDWVTARAAKKADGSTVVYIVNKSNRDVRTKLVIDGKEYKGSFTQEQIAFKSLRDNPSWAELENPLKMSVYSKEKGLIVKPYSVTVITDINID